jgi:hypothetical protein
MDNGQTSEYHRALMPYNTANMTPITRQTSNMRHPHYHS